MPSPKAPPPPRKPPPPPAAKPAAPPPGTPPRNPPPGPTTPAAAGPEPLRPVKPAPEPAANPVHGLPPPELPRKNVGGRPRKDGSPAQPRNPAAETAPATPGPNTTAPPSPPDGPRELPQDPDARAHALESVAGEVKLALGILELAVERLPPFAPLTPAEKDGLSGPLAEVIWKWTGTLSPEAKLAGALGGVAIVRYAVWAQMSPDAREGAKLAAKAKFAGAGSPA